MLTFIFMTPMKPIQWTEDKVLLCIKAERFPENIADAFDQLHQLLPPAPDRKIYGISRPEHPHKIVYRAAAEILTEEEAQSWPGEVITLPKGHYQTLWVENPSENPQQIGEAFAQLLQSHNLDPEGYCVEAYAADGKSVQCLVRIMH